MRNAMIQENTRISIILHKESYAKNLHSFHTVSATLGHKYSTPRVAHAFGTYIFSYNESISIEPKYIHPFERTLDNISNA
jgi:hypothetical protein